MQELIRRINNKASKLELYNVYTSTRLTSMCFTILDQVVRQENLQIKTCLNCGRYFIPNHRQNKIYCDLANPDQRPTCKEKGANEQYKKNLENNQTQALYRRIYRQKFMITQRNKDSKIIQKEFEQLDDRFYLEGVPKLIENDIFTTIIPINEKENVPVNVPVNLNKTENEILNLIIKNNNITHIEIANVLKITDKTAKRNTKKLKEKGIIERIGSDKTGYWKIL